MIEAKLLATGTLDVGLIGVARDESLARGTFANVLVLVLGYKASIQGEL